VSQHHPTRGLGSVVSFPTGGPERTPAAKMDFMDIWCQKEAIFVGNFERWRGPQTSRSPGNSPFPRLDGPVFSRFRDIACFVRQYSHLFHTPLLFWQKFWGVVGVPYGVDPWCWVCKGLRPRLINREIVLDVLQRVWAKYLNVTGTRTNGDSLLWRYRALRIASRGKN